MKTLLIISGIALTLAVGIVSSVRFFYPKAQPVPTESTASPVSIKSFSVAEHTSDGKRFRKLTVTISNDSDKDVYGMSLGLLAVSNDQSEVRVFSRRENKLAAHTTRTFDRQWEYGPMGELAPHLRSVVFEDGSFLGDLESAYRIKFTREIFTEIINQYESQILALDTSETPLPDTEKIAQLIRMAIPPYSNPSTTGEKFTVAQLEDLRSRLRESTYRHVLSELYQVEMLFTKSKNPPRGYGRRIVDDLRSRF